MKNLQKYFDDLARVCHVSEVCELWNVDQKTVMNWIDKGYIAAIQEKEYSPWMVSVRSVIDYRGKPYKTSPRINHLTPIK